MCAVGQRVCGISPGAAAVGDCAAQQGRAVKHLHRGVRFRRAGQGKDIGARDLVTDGACIGRERGDARGHWRCGVNGHAQRRRGRTGIGGRIARRRCQAVRAVGQRRRRIAPGAAAVGDCAAQQGGAVKHLHRGVRFRRSGQRQRGIIGDAVAGRAAVGRERRDTRRRRRHRINRHIHDR